MKKMKRIFKLRINGYAAMTPTGMIPFKTA